MRRGVGGCVLVRCAAASATQRTTTTRAGRAGRGRDEQARLRAWRRRCSRSSGPSTPEAAASPTRHRWHLRWRGRVGSAGRRIERGWRRKSRLSDDSRRTAARLLGSSRGSSHASSGGTVSRSPCGATSNPFSARFRWPLPRRPPRGPALAVARHRVAVEHRRRSTIGDRRPSTDGRVVSRPCGRSAGVSSTGRGPSAAACRGASVAGRPGSWCRWRHARRSRGCVRGRCTLGGHDR